MNTPRLSKEELAEVVREIDKGQAERERAQVRLVELCRHIEPTLRDLGANHQADRIAAILGELDAINARMKEQITRDPLAMLDVLLHRMKQE